MSTQKLTRTILSVTSTRMIAKQIPGLIERLGLVAVRLANVNAIAVAQLLEELEHVVSKSEDMAKRLEAAEASDAA